MKHYKSVEILSIFRMTSHPAQTQSPPAETQSPPIKNFLATVLRRIRALQRIEGVRLDWLAHTPVCKIESC